MRSLMACKLSKYLVETEFEKDLQCNDTTKSVVVALLYWRQMQGNHHKTANPGSNRPQAQ